MGTRGREVKDGDAEMDPLTSPFATPLRIPDATYVEDFTSTASTKAKLNVSYPKTESGSTKHSATKPFVSTSMSALTDAPVPTAISATHARFVETPMGLTNARPEDIFPIVTRLKPDAWEHALKDAGVFELFDDIPEGLRTGFLVGLERFSLASTFIPDNHYTSEEDEKFVISKYAEEIELGRISHGYDPDYLFSIIGHFRTAPLAVIEQSFGKRRVIVNHSFPHNKSINLNDLPLDTSENYILDPTTTSINVVIDSKKFQCAWGSFSECYLLVADAPRGTQAAIFDVDAAFRNIPTHPSARPFLAIMVEGLIHLDHVLNFGACPAPGIFGRVADAMVRILLYRGIDALIKWVDDFIFLRYPKSIKRDGTLEYNYDANLVWDVAEELGWPWARAKFVDFASAFMYIGFWWDLDLKTVELPLKKKTKYLERINSWIVGSYHAAKDIDRVIGEY
jgi:hypothetical protein